MKKIRNFLGGAAAAIGFAVVSLFLGAGAAEASPPQVAVAPVLDCGITFYTGSLDQEPCAPESVEERPLPSMCFLPPLPVMMPRG